MVRRIGFNYSTYLCPSVARLLGLEVAGAEIVGNVEKIILVSFQVSHSGGESKNHFESKGFSCNN